MEQKYVFPRHFYDYYSFFMLEDFVDFMEMKDNLKFCRNLYVILFLNQIQISLRSEFNKGD